MTGGGAIIGTLKKMKKLRLTRENKIKEKRSGLGRVPSWAEKLGDGMGMEESEKEITGILLPVRNAKTIAGGKWLTVICTYLSIKWMPEIAIFITVPLVDLDRAVIQSAVLLRSCHYGSLRVRVKPWLKWNYKD